MSYVLSDLPLYTNWTTEANKSTNAEREDTNAGSCPAGTERVPQGECTSATLGRSATAAAGSRGLVGATVPHCSGLPSCGPAGNPSDTVPPAGTAAGNLRKWPADGSTQNKDNEPPGCWYYHSPSTHHLLFYNTEFSPDWTSSAVARSVDANGDVTDGYGLGGAGVSTQQGNDPHGNPIVTNGARKYRVCKECPKGKSSVKNYDASQAACTYCVAGKYQDTVGQGTCIDCPAGKYVNKIGRAHV